MLCQDPGVKQTISMMRAAFPDLRIEVEEQVGEAGIVVSCLSGSGTHRGEFMGIRVHTSRLP
ncbi:MAG: ester cyclase [Actinobacteria bacterium]|nr:MAG: ester cyclase [Actinomycetota bacterium]